MKYSFLFKTVLALSLVFGTSNAIAHVGHGDEFEATGGVNRVQVNPETDSLLGIQVNPIEAATDRDGVLIPVTALVEDNGRQLVFVQYENYYEPVDVTLGETQGELVEIIEGLSVGEQLVSQGSLSLYAESRKSQNSATSADANPSPETDAQQSQPASEVEAISETTRESTGNFPVGLAIAIASGAGLLVVGGLFLKGRPKD